MRLSVIGAGYVGLVSAVCLANRGYEVILSTEDPQKAKLINQGMPPFHEIGLEESLKRALDSGKLQVTLGREDAVINSDITFVAVGTPSRRDGSIDLAHIKDSSVKIGRVLGRKGNYHLVVIRSTVRW